MSKYVSYSNEIVDNFSYLVKAFETKKNSFSKEQCEEYGKRCETLKTAIQDIKGAIKFKIPSCNHILSSDSPSVDDLKNFVEVVNLPFDSICVELDIIDMEDNKEKPFMLLAKQDGDWIHLYTFFNKVRDWHILEDQKTLEVVKISLNRTDFKTFVTGLSGYYESSISNWLHDVPLRIITNLLCVLSCSNAHIDDHPEKPSKLKNDMRRNKNKLPFFEFKTLTIDSNKNEVKAKNTGKHASHRVHLRRGHIRRLKTKNIWVNACVVGDKSIGEIKKDYLIK